jgi:hypothetical protein
VHQPLGSFDLTGERGRFDPPEGRPLPIDVFFVESPEPAVIMREWAPLTGRPVMPPLWSLGYQQSHRTLDGPEEMRAWIRAVVAETGPEARERAVVLRGETIVPVSEAFGPCFERVSTPMETGTGVVERYEWVRRPGVAGERCRVW